MRSVAALVSGIRGAENGSVDLFVRGTSTRAQIFTNYDGSGAQTPSAALPLDANGRPVVGASPGGTLYVNQAVTVRAFDSLGAIVCEFTDMETATDVEVISRSFTGQNYTTGASGYSAPTMLSTVLDRWFTSAGAIDWNVAVDAFGTSSTLQSAIRAVSGMFINVKDPAYGATGNGSTDDRAAIQAAITAANAIGAWLFFPPGTYLIGAGLTFNGCAGMIGPHGAVMNCTANAVRMLDVGAGANGKFEIIGMSFTGSGVTGSWLRLQGGDLLLLDVVGTFTYTTTTIASFIEVTVGDAVTAIASKFTIPMNGGLPVAPFNGKTVAFIYCEFDFVLNAGFGALDAVLCSDGIIAGCDFTSTNSLQGYIEASSSSGQALSLIGNDFKASAAGNVIAGVVTSNLSLFEAGNTFGSLIVPVLYATGVYADTTAQWGKSVAVETREAVFSSDAAGITLTAGYHSYRVIRATAGAQTLTIPVAQLPGQWLHLTIKNTSGGAPVETLTTIKGLASVNPAAGTRQTIVATSVIDAGALVWVLVSSTNWT